MYYTFTVKTADERNAGTDSMIYFTLVSENGESSTKIGTSDYIKGNAYQQGDLDSFCIDFDGFDKKVEKLIIETDAKGSASGWKCYFAKVYCDTHSASVFHIDQFITEAGTKYTYTTK